MDLGDINMEVAERIGLELALARLLALDVRQPDMPWRCRQRCSEERVRWGIVGCRA
jgi:hypothetical protein